MNGRKESPAFERTPNGKKIVETFFEPSRGNPKPQGKVEVEISVDFRDVKKNIGITLTSNDPALNGARGLHDCHREVGRGHPYDQIQGWRNAEGLSFSKWLDTLCDNGNLIPTPKEKNGGKSYYDNHLKRFREECQREMGRRKPAVFKSEHR